MVAQWTADRDKSSWRCCCLAVAGVVRYHPYLPVGRVLPIVVEKTVELSGLWREFQCIFSTQSEIGLFPVGEGSLYGLRIGDLQVRTT